MSAKSRVRSEPPPVLLDPDTLEVPFRLSVDDLYLHAGADRRDGRHPLEDREEER